MGIENTTTQPKPGTSATPAPSSPDPLITATSTAPVEVDPRTSTPTSTLAPPSAPIEGEADDLDVPQVKDERRVLTIPTHAMKTIKQDERVRGRNETLAELDNQAVALGFTSHAELIEDVKARKAAQAQQVAQQQQAAQQVSEAPLSPEDASAEKIFAKERARLEAEHERVREQLMEEKRRLNRARARGERENVKLKEQLQEMETTAELKLAAKDAGVDDVDYAVTLLKRRLSTMSDAELNTFDENKFFKEELRKSRPHLYRAEERPVNTGISDTPPKVASQTVKKSENGSVDARSLSPKEFQDLLRKRGLSSPSTGGMLG